MIYLPLISHVPPRTAYLESGTVSLNVPIKY
jgi:hypothetical protein